jgi:NADH dehydrogenase [ubiquinone] 1 alpha subcomplex assembly factor 7
MILRTPLHDVIRRLIKNAGPMPVWRYMQLCLTHSEHGYYVSRDPLGREGDFITAPEVSQMFGELIGLWCVAVWREMGAPHAIKLIELGPGRGTMMADALRAIRVVPQFYQAIAVHLVEINPRLRERQRSALTGRDVSWHDSFADVPEGPAIVLANEYFDVLPVHQAVKSERGWHERVVALARNGTLHFDMAPEPVPHFELLLPADVREAPVGAIFEWRPNDEIMTIGTRLREQGGAALVIDYGHTVSAAGDTLQALVKHEYADPLESPGRADITAHVDFDALARGADDVGARVHGPAPQGEFLRRLGIETRTAALSAKANPQASEDIIAAMRRLTGSGPRGMGELFKVLGISDPKLPSLAGFSGYGIEWR